MFRRLAPLMLTGILVACGGTTSSAPAATGGGDEGTPAPTDAPTDAAGLPATAPPTAPASSAAAPTATEAPTDDGGVVVDVPDALKFSAPLVGGGEIELATLAGRPVLLWFWAPW